MSRSRILTLTAVLILFGATVWILREPTEDPAPEPGPVSKSVQRTEAEKAKRAHSAVNELQPPGDFVFEYEGKTVTVNLSKAHYNLLRMIRKDLVNPPNDTAGVPDPGVGFLSWPAREARGTETIKTMKCWVIDFKNPSTSSSGDPYFMIRAFVRQEDGALMRMTGFNWSGKRTMSYTVTSGKRAGDGSIQPKDAEATYYIPGTSKSSREVDYHSRY